MKKLCKRKFMVTSIRARNIRSKSFTCPFKYMTQQLNTRFQLSEYVLFCCFRSIPFWPCISFRRSTPISIEDVFHVYLNIWFEKIFKLLHKYCTRKTYIHCIFASSLLLFVRWSRFFISVDDPSFMVRSMYSKSP